MHKIFRVEHSEWRHEEDNEPVFTFCGPYDYSQEEIDIKEWASESSNYHGDNNHPDIFLDKILSKNFPDNYRDHVCGFESIDKLKKWFSKKERKNLAFYGFIVSVYESSQVIHGDKQSLFIPESERIETFSLESLKSNN